MNTVNRIKSPWIRPWNTKQFNDLYNRDERFFSILIKGALSWLTSNLVLYNKPINHFIFNTGSSYLYVESNGYQFSMNETSGEDQMYMKMPRCVIEVGEINIPTEELSAPYVRGVYERRDGNEIKGYNAQIRRMPIELTLTARYVLSNFNESMILIQELIDKVAWQQYFNIIYLGQIINCSIELDSNYRIEINKIDMTDPNTNQKNIEITYKLCSNYPCIDETTSIENKHVIESFRNNTHLRKLQLIWFETIVFDGVCITHDLTIFKSRNGSVHLKLNIFRQRRTHSAHIHLIGIKTFGLDKHLMSFFFREFNDFILD